MANENSTPTTPPDGRAASVREAAFNCPHCGAFTTQYWHQTYAKSRGNNETPLIVDQSDIERIENDQDIDQNTKDYIFSSWRPLLSEEVIIRGEENGGSDSSRILPEASNLYLSKCYVCRKICIWKHKRLLWPFVRGGPTPNPDIPEYILRDYVEAQSIIDLSPRGAAALLRLCVEKLCKHLDAKGDNLNSQIGDLVSRGLHPMVQQSLDAVRVIGNEAVHPGKLDLRDDRETSEVLFRLVNLITEKLVTEPKHVLGVYSSLPESIRKSIEKRDSCDKNGQS